MDSDAQGGASGSGAPPDQAPAAPELDLDRLQEQPAGLQSAAIASTSTSADAAAGGGGTPAGEDAFGGASPPLPLLDLYRMRPGHQARARDVRALARDEAQLEAQAEQAQQEGGGAAGRSGPGQAGHGQQPPAAGWRAGADAAPGEPAAGVPEGPAAGAGAALGGQALQPGGGPGLADDQAAKQRRRQALQSACLPAPPDGHMGPPRFSSRSKPRPHPYHLRPKHEKANYMCPTPDGWRLRLIRTQRTSPPPTRTHPVLLVPGLGSSGAYSFDLSPGVSLADFLAAAGWDAWTCELRGNGASDKPSLLAGRSRWWTIDDYVETDLPAIIRFVLREAHAAQVHMVGHSMGGMIMCGVMARSDPIAARVRSCTALGSGLFLEDSGWRRFEPLVPLARAMWTLPSGRVLRLYGRLILGPLGLPWVDALYFSSDNVDHRTARALMRRNFSNISPGVILQMSTAFKPQGLLSADRRINYADPGRLAKVSAPALFLVGDRDGMCPPSGCKQTWQMWGAADKRFVRLGPDSGFGSHYGHFDILMGLRVESEVFPLIHGWLASHDTPSSRL